MGDAALEAAPASADEILIETAPSPGARGRTLQHHPLISAAVVVVALALALLLASSPRAFAQTTINGLVAAGYMALGAVGLTLVYGTLRLINFAHGDYLTAGAYFGILAQVYLGAPIPLAVAFAVVAMALFSVGLEFSMWAPIRRRGAGALQLLLVALGLSFLIRYTIQFIAGPDYRSIGVDVTTAYSLGGGIQIGKTELVVMLVGFAAIAALAALLKFTLFGKRARALSDSVDLAETTGIDTRRMIVLVWGLAGGLAGLAGMLYAASLGSATPNLGFVLVLSLFAAVIVGGIGNAYGALVAGILIGLVEAWSTVVISPSLKGLVGYVVMVIVLVVRPHGLLGRRISADRGA